MKKVFICSPLRGDIPGNIKRAAGYCRMAVDKGYIPMAPHVYFTQFLDDTNPVERHVGMHMGLEWLHDCAEVWVFGAPSEGMQAEIALAEELGRKVVYFDA